MSKKCIYYLLSFYILLFTLLCTPKTAWAANPTSGLWYGCSWNWDGNTITVKSTTGGIPSTDNTKYPWYPYVYQARRINIDVIGSIGDSAFTNCNNVRTIDIGKNVNYIGIAAFGGVGTFSGLGDINIYLRYNGQMTFGKYPFARSTAYLNSPTYLYVWKANSNYLTYSQTIDLFGRYTSYGPSAIYYFDDRGQSYDCQHPSWSGWQINSTNHYQICTQCGCIVSNYNHNYDDYYGNTATCTNPGVIQRRCNTCGYVETSRSSALGHLWPTSYSQSGGYLYKNCTRCETRLETKGISYTIVYDGNGSPSAPMTNQYFTQTSHLNKCLCTLKIQ